MAITFNVSKEARKSLGTNILKNADTLTAIQARVGKGVEAGGAVHPTISYNSYNEETDKDIIALLNRMPEKHRATFIKCKEKEIAEGFSHPFVEALHTAYDKHYPLEISPDSVWLCIAQGLANHINVNSESLRDKFVSHKGKELIVLRRDSFRKGSPGNDWQGCFGEFSEKIHQVIGNKSNLLVSNFSTTGLIEKAASEVVLMDSMKSYFKFGVKTLCGIPRITITGTVEDWKNILFRVENLAEFGLEWWTKNLLPIISKVIDTVNGDPDVKFWDEIYKKHGGSGGPYVSGWFNMLFPYLQSYKGNLVENRFVKTNDSKASPTLDAFPSGLSKVPFKWEYYDTTYDMEFLGGMVGFTQDIKTLTIIPNIGWAVRDTSISRPGEINPNEDW